MLQLSPESHSPPEFSADVVVLQICLSLAKILGGESVSLAKEVGGESVSLAKGSDGERVGGERGSGESVSGEKDRWRKGL